MTVALRQPMTVDQFLAWEEGQEGRHEFDGFAPVAMTGGTFEHDAIQVNLLRALANRLAGTPCRAHGNSIKVEVAGSIRYSDAFVTCGPILRGSTVLRDPVVIFEVLSRGTARTDRMVKNREYAATPSVRRYVMLEQGTVGATMFERPGADWIGRILGADAVIRMPEIGIEIPLTELSYAAAAAQQRHSPPDIVVPPRASAVPSSGKADSGVQSQRDRRIRLVEPRGSPDMAERDRMGWQRTTGHGRRNQAETAMARYKHLIGPKLHARSLPTQRGEVAIAAAVLNRMIRTAKPVSIRVA